VVKVSATSVEESMVLVNASVNSKNSKDNGEKDNKKLDVREIDGPEKLELKLLKKRDCANLNSKRN